MEKINLGFISTTITGAFDQKVAEKNYQDAKSLLTKLGKKEDFRLIANNKMVITRDETREILEKFKISGVDLIILHASCFASGEIAQEIASFLNLYKIPIVVWGVPEPEGGCLTVNSFCCANFYTGILHSMDVSYKWIFGAPSDGELQNSILETIKVVSTIQSLREVNVGIIGSARVPGFYGSNFDELGIKKRFGISISRIDLSDFFLEYKNIRSSRVSRGVKDLRDKYKRNLGTKDDIKNSVRAYLALKDISERRKLGGLALKCWPEVRETLSCELCLPMAILCDNGIMCSDESDVLGLVSMLTSYNLNGKKEPATLLDMVHFDKKKNTVGLWHCGASALSIAGKNCKICLAPHPIVEEYAKNLKKGLVAEETLKEGPVTILRLQGLSGERYFATEGEVTGSSMRFRGAYADVRLDEPVADVVNIIMTEGIVHHYSLSYTRHKRLINEFCYWLNIKPVQNNIVENEPFGRIKK